MDTIGFKMKIEGVNPQIDRGIFAEGTILQGKVFLGDCLEIIGNSILKTHVAAIEKKISKNDDQKQPEYKIAFSAKSGENVRLLLTNSFTDNICIGHIISTPKSVK